MNNKYILIAPLFAVPHIWFKCNMGLTPSSVDMTTKGYQKGLLTMSHCLRDTTHISYKQCFHFISKSTQKEQYHKATITITFFHYIIKISRAGTPCLHALTTWEALILHDLRQGEKNFVVNSSRTHSAT